MDKRKKIVAALAIGAVALAIGSGAVRAAVTQPDAGQQQDPVRQEQPAEPPQEGGSGGQTGAEKAADPLSELYGAQWVADGGEGTLAFMDGAMVESAGGAERAVAYRAENVKTTDDGISATLYVSDGRGGAETPAALAVTKGTGGMRLACDALQRTYTPATGEGAIELAGTDGNLEAALGKGEDEVRQAISAWASTRSPYAKRATWSKEVWADYGSGTIVTTFTLDDAAGTIVSVTRDASGELAAS